MGFFHKSGIIRLEVCVVLHNYAIQFLLVSKFRHAMQSRHQTEMAKGHVFLYLIISSIYIIYSQVLSYCSYTHS